MGRTFDHNKTFRSGNTIHVVLSFTPSARYSKMRAFAIAETRRYLQFNKPGFGKWIEIRKNELLGKGKGHRHRIEYISVFEEGDDSEK